jgi:hypothetical protein
MPARAVGMSVGSGKASAMRDESPFERFVEDINRELEALRDAWLMHPGDCEREILDFKDEALLALRRLREAGGDA